MVVLGEGQRGAARVAGDSFLCGVPCATFQTKHWLGVECLCEPHQTRTILIRCE